MIRIKIVALKGQNNTANHAGIGSHLTSATFGIDPMFRPFRATEVYLGSIPRALPWAGLLWPFRPDAVRGLLIAWPESTTAWIAIPQTGLGRDPPEGRKYSSPGHRPG